MIETIKNDVGNILIEYKPNYSIICSIGKTSFHGNMVITYIPNEKLLEFESFEKWLFSISNESETIESFAKRVHEILIEILEPSTLTVEIHAETVVHGKVVVTI